MLCDTDPLDPLDQAQGSLLGEWQGLECFPWLSGWWEGRRANSFRISARSLNGGGGLFPISSVLDLPSLPFSFLFPSLPHLTFSRTQQPCRPPPRAPPLPRPAPDLLASASPLLASMAPDPEGGLSDQPPLLCMLEGCIRPFLLPWLPGHREWGQEAGIQVMLWLWGDLCR